MQVINTQVRPRSAAFRANADAMSRLVEDLRAKATEVEQGGDLLRGISTSREASCCRAIASRSRSTQARLSSRSGSSTRTLCTTAMRLVQV